MWHSWGILLSFRTSALPFSTVIPMHPNLLLQQFFPRLSQDIHHHDLPIIEKIRKVSCVFRTIFEASSTKLKIIPSLKLAANAPENGAIPPPEKKIHHPTINFQSRFAVRFAGGGVAICSHGSNGISVPGVKHHGWAWCDHCMRLAGMSCASP